MLSFVKVGRFVVMVVVISVGFIIFFLGIVLCLFVVFWVIIFIIFVFIGVVMYRFVYYKFYGYFWV